MSCNFFFKLSHVSVVLSWKVSSLWANLPTLPSV